MSSNGYLDITDNEVVTQFESGIDIEARLKQHKIPYNGPIPQMPGLLGIYFYDPSGFRLEFACQPEDADAPAVIPCVTQTKAEAARELATMAGADTAWIKEMTGALPD